MEGLIVLVRKNGKNTFGSLEGVITIAHLDFYSYNMHKLEKKIV